MAPQGRQLGHATLDLLAEDWTVPVMRELLDGPLRPSELEQRLPAAPHSGLMRRLSAMHSKRVVTRERHHGPPPSARYGLTEAGKQILDVLAVAKHWERQWGLEDRRGLGALRLIGDERTREIILGVAEGPVSASDLQGRLRAPVARSTLRQRVAGLARRGVLARTERDGIANYDLTDSARGLGRVAIAAARWEWEWDRPEQPVAAAEVAGVLHLFAPAARLPAELGGVCRMRVDDHPPGPDVYIAADGRRVATLPLTPQAQPQGACHATPQGWCDALLLRRWSDVTCTGNTAFTAALLASVSAALLS